MRMKGIGLFLACLGFGKDCWEEETTGVSGKKELGTIIIQHWTTAMMTGKVLGGEPIAKDLSSVSQYVT